MSAIESSDCLKQIRIFPPIVAPKPHSLSIYVSTQVEETELISEVSFPFFAMIHLQCTNGCVYLA